METIEATADGNREALEEYKSGCVFLTSGELVNAEICFRKVLELNPYRGEAYTKLCELMYRQSKIMSGIDYGIKAVALTKNSSSKERGEAHQNLASCLYRVGRMDEASSHLQDAISHYKDAIILSPKDSSLHKALAECYQEARNYMEAEKCYLEALVYDANICTAYIGLCFIKCSQKNYEKALEYGKRSLSLASTDSPGETAEAHYWLAESLFGVGQMEEGHQHNLLAMNSMKAALAQNPLDSLMLCKLGNSHMKEKLFHEAENHYRRVLKLDSDLGMGHMNLCIALLLQNSHTAGIEAGEKAVSLMGFLPAKELAEAHYWLARCYLDSNLHSQAQEHFVNAMNLDPENAVFADCAKESEKSCFVATAAMGSASHQWVVELSEFRDRYLNNSEMGRNLVSLYYRVGSVLANVIFPSKLLRRVAMILVVLPGIAISRSISTLFPTPKNHE